MVTFLAPVSTERIPDERLLESAAAPIRIRAGGLLPIDGYARAGRVACRAGTVWVTQAGDAGDHVLRAGESFAASGRGKVVVQALTDAEVVIA